MRLLLKLVPKKSHAYVNDYHYHLQAAIYSLIREGGLPDVHEKKGYKFFCFSNIFPFGEFSRSVEKHLLISSPNSEITSAIRASIGHRIASQQPLKIGELDFGVTEAQYLSTNFANGIVGLRAATPIIIRVPSRSYGNYGIVSHRPYENWRENLPLEIFVKQLLDNMAKKVKEFIELENKQGINSFEGDPILPEIIQYRYLRSVAKPIKLRRNQQLVVGSLWELWFSVKNLEAANSLAIAADSGLGERNSLGFGFVNQFMRDT